VSYERARRGYATRHGQGVSWHQLGSIDFNEEKYDAARPKFVTTHS